MTTDQELEQLIRATFSGRARTVARGPVWAGTPAAQVGGPGPRRRWLAALAAAAAVIAVVAGVVAIEHARRTPAPAVSHPPTPTPTTVHASPTTAVTSQPAPSPTTTVQNVTPTACTTALPQAWKTALQNSLVDTGSATPNTATSTPLGTTSDGVLVVRDDGPTPGSGREVVLLRAGQAPKTLYSVPDPDRYNVAYASMSGTWLVVGVELQVRPGKNSIGGNTPDVLDAIVAVDTTTGHAKVIESAPDYRVPGAAPDSGIAIVDDVVMDGKVYWNERPTYAASTGTVKSYDLASGDTATVASHDNGDGYLGLGAGGVVFDPQGADTLLVRASLPAPLDAALTPFGRLHLQTDGTAYAWAADVTTLGWWRPGMAAPVYVAVPGGIDNQQNGANATVAGPYAITVNGNGAFLLVDMLTRASAPLVDANFPNGRGQLYFGSQGVFSGFAASGISSHYVNGYWLDSPYDVIRLDTAALPKLTC